MALELDSSFGASDPQVEPCEPVIQAYLMASDAADYACMPLADFLPAARRCGLVSFSLYRQADIQAAMARGWRGPFVWSPPRV
jgi:hypothetical protein